MQNTKTTIALYARKSKYTEKGLSIQNQVDTCKRYIREHFAEGTYEIRIYQDEGISGKDLERPEMQAMLHDIYAGSIDVLVCYRLDRVSRSVRDFSNLIGELISRNREFVSVSEAFDTRTPMGRAMIMICSVFSQLERETITERITDNLYALAKTGRWLGGNTPMGFESEKVVQEDHAGKKRSRYRLIPVPEEQELVKIIFVKYRALGSLTKLETFLMNAGYRTRKNNRFFSRYVLRAMLTNPVYCTADEGALAYLREHGYGIYADRSLFDGEHGLIAYNKNNNTGKGQRVNAVEDWVVAVGEHKGVIDSSLWMAVQDKISDNSSLSYRKPRKNDAILSGMIRCGCCGSLMRPKSSRKTRDGVLQYFYVCEQKERSRGKLCHVPNIPGRQLDELVMGEILSAGDEVITEYHFLEKKLERLARVSAPRSESVILKRQIENNQRQLDTLLNSLGRSGNEATTDSILQRMDEISRAQSVLWERLESRESDKVTGFNLTLTDDLADSLLSMDLKSLSKLSAFRRKEILQTVIKEIMWDGEDAEIHLRAEEMTKAQGV